MKKLLILISFIILSTTSFIICKKYFAYTNAMEDHNRVHLD
ncbi:hypothetical protein AABD41_09715 [Staphylococcus pseudoxylosus]